MNGAQRKYRCVHFSVRFFNDVQSHRTPKWSAVLFCARNANIFPSFCFFLWTFVFEWAIIVEKKDILKGVAHEQIKILPG